MSRRGARVYEDVPSELFAARLPAWPQGDTMSYSIDRSAGTRGVGAVASRDLREGRGGAVIRTGSGPVRIVSKSALGAVSSTARRHDAGGTGSKRPAPRKAGGSWSKPSSRSQAQRAAFAQAQTRAQRKRSLKPAVVPTPTPRPGVRATRTPFKLAPFATTGVMTGAVFQPVTTPSGTPPTAPSYGGGGGGFTGGGGFGPASSEASIREAEAAAEPREEAATPEAPAAPEKKPMSKGAKVVLGLGAAAALFYMWKGGDLG